MTRVSLLNAASELMAMVLLATAMVTSVVVASFFGVPPQITAALALAFVLTLWGLELSRRGRRRGGPGASEPDEE